MSDGTPSSQNGRLTGWKEIGQYLGKSARTVQRYERQFGLPIRRIRTEREGQIIFAECHEIDAWLKQQTAETLSDRPESNSDATPSPMGLGEGAPDSADEPRRSSPGRWWRTTAAGLALVALLTVAWFYWPRSRPEQSATPAGPTVYVVVQNGLVTVDEVSGRFGRPISLPEDATFGSLTWVRPGRAGTVLIGTEAPSGVIRFDPATSKWSNWIAVPGHRLKAAAEDDAGAVGIVDQDGVLHVASWSAPPTAQPKTVAIPEQSFDATFSPQSRHLLVSSRDDGALLEVDLKAPSVISKKSVGKSAGRAVISKDGAHLFATNHRDGSVTCVSFNSGDQLTTPVGTRPFAIALDRSERALFVANRDSHSVSVIDASSCGVVATLPDVIGNAQLVDLVVGSDETRLYVTANTGRLAILDITDRRQPRVLSVLELPAAPMGLFAAGK